MQKLINSLFLPLLSATLYAVSLCSYATGLLSFVALAPIIYQILNQKPMAAARSGFVFANIGFVCVCYWLINTLSAKADLSLAVSLAIFVVVMVIVSLYYAILAFLISTMASKTQSHYQIVLLVACLWVVVEFLRANSVLYVPWGFIGHAVIDLPYLPQIANLVGVYGLSWQLLACNTALALLVIHRHNLNANKIFSITLVPVLAISAGLVYGFYSQLRHHTAVLPKLTPVLVTHGNYLPTDPTPYKYYFNTTYHWLQSNKNALVVWPETVIPQAGNTVPPNIEALLADTNSLLLSGARYEDTRQKKTYNAAFLFSTNQIEQYYFKRKPVPFIENQDSGVFKLMRRFASNLPSVDSGNTPGVMLFKESVLGISICYEILFSRLIASDVQQGAQFLVNIADESWFRDRFFSKQYLDLSRYRAIENGRYLVKASNWGSSAVINPTGELLKEVKPSQDQAIDFNVPSISTMTIYTRFGDYFIALCLILLIIMWQLSYLKHAALAEKEKKV